MNTRRTRKQPVVVQRTELEEPRWQQHRNAQRIRNEFLERERARGRGRAQATQEPTRKRPTRAVDGDVKMCLSRGYSEEVARELAAQAPSVPSYWATRLGGEIV